MNAISQPAAAERGEKMPMTISASAAAIATTEQPSAAPAHGSFSRASGTCATVACCDSCSARI